MAHVPDTEGYIALASVEGRAEVVLGTLVGIDGDGSPQVDWEGNPRRAPVKALATSPYGMGDVNRHVALLFVGGDPSRPLILGIVRRPLDAILDAEDDGDAAAEAIEPPREPDRFDRTNGSLVAHADDDRVEISGDKEVVLRCGDASITLTRAGKVLIRGKQILSRSTGSNRMKGGSIQLN